MRGQVGPYPKIAGGGGEISSSGHGDRGQGAGRKGGAASAKREVHEG